MFWVPIHVSYASEAVGRPSREKDEDYNVRLATKNVLLYDEKTRGSPTPMTDRRIFVSGNDLLAVG